jgi:RNA polymerase sigma-70 factor (ECF subfamily)
MSRRNERHEMNETELLKAAMGKDRAAFSGLYDMYKARLYRYALYKLGDREDAEDAVSSCVLSAWEEIGKLRDPEAFPAWIFRILRSSCARLIKEKVRSKDDVSSDQIAELEERDPDRTDVRLMLVEALEKLPEDSREMVLLSAVAGLTSKEIGDIYDMPAGTVRSRVSRSMSEMRRVLEAGNER